MPAKPCGSAVSSERIMEEMEQTVAISWSSLWVLLLQAVHFLMDDMNCKVTLEEFRLFHGIDRELYRILVGDLCRDSSESIQIMGLWLWLERAGFSNVVSKISSLPPFLINEFAEEAVACLMCMNVQFPFSAEAAEIPLTHSLVERDISLQFFQQNRLTTFHEVQNLISEVCIPALSDIMEMARCGRLGESLTQSQMMLGHAASSSSGNRVVAPSTPNDSLTEYFAGLSIGGDPASSSSRGRSRSNETSRHERTMFVTFSKGYPVTESEVRQFFTRIFGNCLESFHMQEVLPNEQSLYARIVFLNPSFINMILNGVNKAKFTINGKHVWMRKFVPRNARVSS